MDDSAAKIRRAFEAELERLEIQTERVKAGLEALDVIEAALADKIQKEARSRGRSKKGRTARRSPGRRSPAAVSQRSRVNSRRAPSGPSDAAVSSTGAAFDRAECEARILGALRELGEPTFGAVLMERAGVNGYPFKKAVEALIGSGKVVTTGARRGLRYALPLKSGPRSIVDRGVEYEAVSVGRRPLAEAIGALGSNGDGARP